MHETTVMTSKDLLIISEALSHYSIGHLDKADRIVVGMMNDNWPADTQTGSYLLRKGPLFRYHFKRLRAGADRKTRSIGFFHPGSIQHGFGKLEQCGINYGLPEGRIIPFCSHNIVQRLRLKMIRRIN